MAKVKTKEVNIYPKGSKKDLEHRLERLDRKIESEKRYYFDSLKPLQELKNKIKRELAKL
tara:strand:+ start:379 stop:558 length:180 start_codon:yes stop_codon:yes gene_type:complete